MDLVEITRHVKTLKTLILHARYVAARQANAEMLKLYFVIGAYVSEHSRKGKWGTGVIEAISEQLSRELPGLRGFSARNMRDMRHFCEEWTGSAIWRPLAAKLKLGTAADCQSMAREIWQPLAAKLESGKLEVLQPAADELGQFDLGAFLSIGFTHHMIIISKCKTAEERLFYIRRCAAGFWSKDALKQHLAANEYETEGHAVNNFALRDEEGLSIILLSLRGVSESRSSEGNSKESQSLQNSKTPSSESNINSASLRVKTFDQSRKMAERVKRVMEKLAAGEDGLLSLRGVSEFWRGEVRDAA